MASKKTVSECLTILCEALDKKPTKVTFQAWQMALEDLTDQEVEKATRIILKQDRQFFPKPGELIAIIKPAELAEPSLESQAITAFNNLVKSLDENKPSVACPVTRHIADMMGGHQALWAMSQREFDFKRRDFIKTYIALAECEPEKLKQLEALPHVPNSRLPVPEPYKPLIGNITNGRLSHDC